MKAASEIEALEISMDMMGKQNTIYPTLIRDYDTVVLVDAGYPGQLPLIRDKMEKSGALLANLNKVIITHHDLDHTGGLSGILAELPGKVEVLGHVEEKQYVQAEKPPTKITQIESRMDPKGLEPEIKLFYQYLKDNYKKLKARVDRTVDDGEDLPYCGGITVIHTPGHTPGHICLYHRQSKTLIAGDALFVEGGLLVPAPEFVNFDAELAVNSLRKLTRYDIEKVICYHGGIYKDACNQRIAELAKR